MQIIVLEEHGAARDMEMSSGKSSGCMARMPQDDFLLPLLPAGTV